MSVAGSMEEEVKEEPWLDTDGKLRDFLEESRAMGMS